MRTWHATSLPASGIHGIKIHHHQIRKNLRNLRENNITICVRPITIRGKPTIICVELVTICGKNHVVYIRDIPVCRA